MKLENQKNNTFGSIYRLRIFIEQLTTISEKQVRGLIEVVYIDWIVCSHCASVLNLQATKFMYQINLNHTNNYDKSLVISYD